MNFRELICLALTAYLVVLFARALMSWFPIAPESPFARVNDALRVATEPVLKPFRSLIPTAQVGGMALDLSFMVVFLILILIRGAICSGV